MICTCSESQVGQKNRRIVGGLKVPFNIAIVQMGHSDHDEPQVPGDDPFRLQGQVSHRLEADQG
jgi:hypothetical protein